MVQHINDVLKGIIKANPRASEKELSNLTWEKINDQQIKQIFDYWFANAYRSFRVEVDKNSVTILRQYRDMRAERAEGKKRRSIIKQKLNMALMDHMLSNGKLLRDGTFGDCAKEGGWLLAVSKLGKPNEIVGKKLTETDLINIRSRNRRKRA